MGKHINVNPNYYKTAGREDTSGPDNGADRTQEKQELARHQPTHELRKDHPAVMRSKKHR